MTILLFCITVSVCTKLFNIVIKCKRVDGLSISFEKSFCASGIKRYITCVVASSLLMQKFMNGTMLIDNVERKRTKHISFWICET